MTQELVMSSLPDVTEADVEAIIARQNEPAWLAERRRTAWRTYEAMRLPDPGEEEWRRTDVRALNLSGLRPRAVTHKIVGDAPRVIATSMRSAIDDPDNVGFDEAFGDIIRHDEWKFLALNDAMWSDGLYVHVARDTDAELTIAMTTDGLTDGSAVFPRSLIIAHSGSRVRIVDESRSDDVRSAFVSSAVEILVEDGARVEYYDVNRWGDGVYNFKTVRANVGRDAHFLGMAVGVGAKLTKMRFDAEMPKAGGSVELLGVTFGSGDQHFDYNTRQEHTGEHTISDLQFKSALTDRASLVWYGVTRINPGATASEANQTSRNLLLSEHAKAAPIPILEIEAYDVAKCSHGATAGPVEESELFYLEARAIPRDVAQQMLVEGFFANVVDRIPDAAVRARIADAVLAKIGGGVGTLTFDEMISA